MLITCPKPTALTGISAVTCGMRFDQIVKFGLQRVQASGPSFDGTNLITIESEWDTLKAASDATKMIFSPMFQGMVIPPSENQEEGGNDNSTINGIPINLGENPVKVTGFFRNLPAAVKAQLDLLAVESLSSFGTPQVWIYLFNRYGQIISQGNAGIPIYNFRISTPGSEGYNKDNINNFSFILPANWDTNLVVQTPSFDPLTKL